MKDTDTNANASDSHNHARMNAGKMPAFQFYPGDWLKDPALQSLGYETQGIWMNILCRMHESDERGVLTIQRQVMSMEALARLLGLEIKKLKLHLDKLLANGLIRRRESDGALYNNRMVKDEKLRQFHQAQGRKGGNPQLLKRQVNPPVNPKPTPSSSPSFSVSSSEKYPPNPPRGEWGDEVEDLERNPQVDENTVETAAPLPPEDTPAVPHTALPRLAQPSLASPPRRTRDRQRADAPPPDPRHHEFIRIYAEAWQRQFADPYPFQKADAARLATLLQTSQLSVEELMEGVQWCWRQIDENSYAPWAVKQAATLRGFCTNYPAISAEFRNTQARRTTHAR